MSTLSFRNLAIADDINAGIDFTVIASKHNVAIEDVEYVANELDAVVSENDYFDDF